MSFSRRTLLLASAAVFFGLADDAEARRRRSGGSGRSRGSRSSRGKNAASKAAAATAPSAPTGNPLKIPELVTVPDAGTFAFSAGFADHAFLKDKPVRMAGYNGGHLGPVLKLVRGRNVTLRLENRLDRPTNLHWHGLLVDAACDGATQPPLAPGFGQNFPVAVDQPSATLWYHAHVHGQVGRDIHDGLAGMLLVEDPADARLGLPSNWGVDDIPLVIQDKDFDADGRPVYAPDGDAVEHGFRARRIAVNGTLDPVVRVPLGLVRLRIVNASSARTYRLYCQDERGFDLIATDGGFLPASQEITMLVLAPGERAEILIDFGLGTTNLMSTPDLHEHRMGATAMSLPDVIETPFRVLGFDAVSDLKSSGKRPAALATLATPDPKQSVKRRRFELQTAPRRQGFAAAADHAQMAHDHSAMGHAPADAATSAPTTMAGHTMAGHAMSGAGAIEKAAPAARLMAINGHSFEMGHVDEEVRFGTTEIWEIVSPEMAHPFHIHGAQFRVLTEDGDTPKTWNTGVKDTVLVENSAELLVTFTRRADRTVPFVYHCHVLEHEDAGMMGAFTVT